MGSTSLTRDQTQAPCIGKHGVLAAGPPGKSPVTFLKVFFIFGCAESLLLHVGLSCGEWGPLVAWWLLLLCIQLWSVWASVFVVHRLSFPTACGIFPDHRSSLCPQHLPLDHQGGMPCPSNFLLDNILHHLCKYMQYMEIVCKPRGSGVSTLGHKSGVPAVCYKILLGCSYTCSFMYCLSCYQSTMAELSSFNRDHMVCKA